MSEQYILSLDQGTSSSGQLFSTTMVKSKLWLSKNSGRYFLSRDGGTSSAGNLDLPGFCDCGAIASAGINGLDIAAIGLQISGRRRLYGIGDGQRFIMLSSGKTAVRLHTVML